MIDFSKAYTAHWRVVRVDKDTWDDGESLDGVVSVTINRDATDSVPLLETASIEIDQDMQDEFEEGWYRVVMIAVQNGEYERYAISTVLLQSIEDNVNYNRVTTKIDGSSVLKPLEERKNVGDDFKYAPKGSNGAEWVYDIINEVTPAPVEIDGDGFTLDNNVVFSPGSTYLQMVWNVLDAGQWVMMIDGDGLITITKRPDVSVYDLSHKAISTLAPNIRRSITYKDVYNRYYAIDRDGTREVAENLDPSSELSYPSRGRWIEFVDTAPTKINGETLYAYVRRRLEEESTLVRQFSYTREYWPNIVPFCLVDATVPEYGIDGSIRVLSQSITCNKAITVNETSGLEIKEWIA